MAAASDLQVALPALIDRFRATAGIEIVPIFGSSGTLAAQIEQGAPFDLFLSADRAYAERLAGQGLLRPESIRPYALGHLVLAIHRDVDINIAGLSDLVAMEIRKISLANPDHAPYGKAAREALKRSALWDTLTPKLVRAASVGQALQFVRSGNAEVGLVARSVADVPEVRIVDLDPALYEPIVQVMGTVADSTQIRDAEQFSRFILGETGQAILESFGLGRVAGAWESPGRLDRPVDHESQQPGSTT